MVTSEDSVQIEQPPQLQVEENSDSENEKIQQLKAENRLQNEKEDELTNGNAENGEENGHKEVEDQAENNGEPMETAQTENHKEEDEEIEKIEESKGDQEASTSTSNGNGTSNGSGTKRAVECIDLDDDDDDDIEEVAKEPVTKKAKTSDDDDIQEVKEIPKKEEDSPQLTSSEKLLDRLQEYVGEAIASGTAVNRKVLDALLGAINLQVQKEPHSVRKLILEKQLVLPNTISFPPSQTVDMLIEHDPDFPLTKVINKMFGDERPRLSDAEKKDRAYLKSNMPAPHMTKMLMDIGQDLVQESTYSDIVHARNLPEPPKNFDTYKQVALQLKPVWETLKKKNEPYKMKLRKCHLCGFQTESGLVLTNHWATLHFIGNKYQCAYCKEFDTNEQRMKEHYFNSHLIIANSDDKESKYPCAICDEDFQFKGVRDQHLKQCKKDYIRVKHIMMPKQDDFLVINRWLWEKPPVDPSILQQQQNQLKKQQQNQQQQVAAQQLQNLRRQQQQMQVVQQQQLLLQQKQQQQRQIQQMAQLMQSKMGNTNLLAAMTAQLRKNGGANTALLAANLQKLQASTLAAAKTSGTTAMQAAVAAASLKAKNVLAAKTAKSNAASSSGGANSQNCEICDTMVADKERYLGHLQSSHKQMSGKTVQDMSQGAPLACSRCRDRFWTYEGLERHLVMSHGLVTADLLQKAQKKEDGGRCKLCGKQYAFNMLQHLVADHQVKLCSAEIMYSCDVCAFKCTSYQTLESHLSTNHPKGSTPAAAPKKKADDCITLDD
ncbi:unnamed protein product [Caenorhabditis angaria]|uniref:C2H2-type domain-containing protein n=1 Tax=Caenorhabditis angaria TaxID=860376 RepID=A0A9P1N5M9_9PELO|nr:unnamed protein product [Caenorhabditis angaria]